MSLFRCLGASQDRRFYGRKPFMVALGVSKSAEAWCKPADMRSCPHGYLRHVAGASPLRDAGESRSGSAHMAFDDALPRLLPTYREACALPAYLGEYLA